MFGTRGLTVLALLAGVVVILASAAYRAGQPDLARPLNEDELITLRYYTWAGVRPDGEPRELRRREDVERLGRPGLRDLALGAYCSFGRWAEPNNHVVNSGLINLTLPLCRPREAAVRLPALLGAVVFAALAGGLCYWVFPARAAVPLVAACALWHPYVLRYSQEARGYSWMLALQLLLLACFVRLLRSPASLAWGFLTAGVAVLSFMNILTVSLYWVFPAYLVMFVIAARDRPLRINLMAQLAGVGAVGLVFLLDRLPFVFSSTQQYGVPFQGGAEYAARLRETADYLFPSAGWKLFAGAGVVGLLLSYRHPWGRVLLGVFGVSLLVSLAHVAVSHRFPYPRVCGYVLPPILIGFGCLVQRLCELIAARWLTGLAWAGCSLATLVLLAAGSWGVAQDPAFADLAATVSGQEARADVPGGAVYTVYGQGVADSLELYLPTGWLGAGDRLPLGDGSSVCVLGKREGADWRGIPCCAGSAEGTRWDPLRWPGAVSPWDTGTYQAVLLAGKCEPLGDGCDGAAHALVCWYPEFRSVAVNRRPALEFADSCGVKYLAVDSRYQAKLNVYGRLSEVIFISESTEDFRRAAEAARTAVRRFGGEVRVFTPRQTAEPTAPGPMR
jgi:hypothetical protein